MQSIGWSTVNPKVAYKLHLWPRKSTEVDRVDRKFAKSIKSTGGRLVDEVDRVDRRATESTVAVDSVNHGV